MITAKFSPELDQKETRTRALDLVGFYLTSGPEEV